MDDIQIWEQLFPALREDRDYRDTGKLIRELEPGYLAALEEMTDGGREAVEAYLRACDAQSDSMILRAYRLGFEKGRLAPLVIRPRNP